MTERPPAAARRLDAEPHRRRAAARRRRPPSSSRRAARSGPARRSHARSTCGSRAPHRAVLGAALSGPGADAVPDRRDPRVPRHAARRLRCERRRVSRALGDDRRRAAVRLADARAVPRADPAGAGGGGRWSRSACRSCFGRRTRALSPWLEQQFGITLALDLASIQATRGREPGQRARPVRCSCSRASRPAACIVISILVNLALIPVVMFYLLRDWNMIGERIGQPGAAALAAEGAHDRARDRSTCSPSSCAGSCW